MYTCGFPDQCSSQCLIHHNLQILRHTREQTPLNALNASSKMKKEMSANLQCSVKYPNVLPLQDVKADCIHISNEFLDSNAGASLMNKIGSHCMEDVYQINAALNALSNITCKSYCTEVWIIKWNTNQDTVDTSHYEVASKEGSRL